MDMWGVLQEELSILLESYCNSGHGYEGGSPGRTFNSPSVLLQLILKALLERQVDNLSILLESYCNGVGA